VLGNFANTVTVGNVENLVGGTAADTVTVSTAIAGGTVDLGAGNDRLVLSAGGNSVTVANVETLVGGSGADTIKVLAGGTPGVGNALHLASELFANKVGVKMLHVPYKGGGPAVADLIAGHVNILFTTILEAVGQVKAGKLNGMAVTSKARSPALPDTPTLSEAGVPGYESGSWIGLMAPAGTPAAILDKIAADTRDIVAQADTRQTLIGQGALPRGETLAQFAAVIDADRRKYARIIIDKGIRSD
jgi:tripartite-type tricarboxylate transporter receptor subunit TctC